MGAQGGRFVIQEHYARSHHFDLRLERDGVLASWAVPKGLPTEPTTDRLAVAVPDHSLDHLEFEDLRSVDGGPPGAVVKRIWDRGHYAVRSGDDPTDKIVFTLRGAWVDATYALIRTDGVNWLLRRSIAHLCGRNLFASPDPTDLMRLVGAQSGSSGLSISVRTAIFAQLCKQVAESARKCCSAPLFDPFLHRTTVLLVMSSSGVRFLVSALTPHLTCRRTGPGHPARWSCY